MIYLNKEHDTNEKYIIYDNILTPLVAFLNNVLSYQEKRKIMKEYGFNVIDKEIEKMCNLGEMIEREAKQAKNIEHLQNVMHELQCSLEKAMDILKLTDEERKEIKKYFFSDFNLSKSPIILFDSHSVYTASSHKVIPFSPFIFYSLFSGSN